MYCLSCECKYTGWGKKCPICRERMLEDLPDYARVEIPTLTYEELLREIEEQGGQVQLHLGASRVKIRKKWGFPYFGFGYAWCDSMHGTRGGITAALYAHDVKMKKQWNFPYRGYGFAWASQYHGSLGGNEFTLASSTVVKKKSWNFPYFGYGRAWVEQMTGQCGERLKLTFTTTDIGKKSLTRFPWTGYGFAWEIGGELSVALDALTEITYPSARSQIETLA